MDDPRRGSSAKSPKAEPHQPEAKYLRSATPNNAGTESDAPSIRPGKVEIYTRRFCADSMRMKGIFDRKNIQYNEYFVDNDVVNISAMCQRCHGDESTPQVFIDGRLIGGLAQVMDLDHSGDLNFLLGIRP